VEIRERQLLPFPQFRNLLDGIFRFLSTRRRGSNKVFAREVPPPESSITSMMRSKIADGGEC
jgi:hypothetical protein